MDDLEKELRDRIAYLNQCLSAEAAQHPPELQCNSCDHFRQELDLHTRCLDAIAWRSVEDGLPEKDVPVLVELVDGSITVDSWVSHREAPVSFSTATVEVGEWWENNDPEEVIKWRPITPKGED